MTSDPVVIRTKSGLTATLYLADCLTVLPTLGKVDACITDPPYGMNLRRGTCRNRGKGVTKGTTGIIGDGFRFNPTPFLDYPIVLMFGPNYYAANLPEGRWLVWDKVEYGGSGDFSDAEFAWLNKPGATKTFHHMWMGVQRASQVGDERLHDTEKPIALMRWCVEQAKVAPGQTILDPFMGSGTTGVAALRMGCNFIGIEISDKYYAIAKRRIMMEAAQGSLFQCEKPQPTPARTAEIPFGDD